MNYKTMLMASAAVLFASQAMAQDLTGAFSVPGKGQIMSDTAVEMGRTKQEWKGWDRWAEDSVIAREIIEYGLTDNLSINGTIANKFDTEGHYNNDHNFLYGLGAKYNMRFDDVLFQIGGRYNTSNPKDFYGHNRPERWRKSLGLDLKAGLDLGNGLTPYIVYSVDSAVDTAHRPIEQSVKAGIHKYTGKWALDGAVRYAWSKNSKAPKNSTATYFDAEADYYLRDNVALGIFGSYLVDAHDQQGAAGKLHVKEGHEIGIRVKVLF